MNRPAISNYVVGNAVSVTTIVAATAFLMYRWCTQEQHGESIGWLVPAVALVMSRASFKARARIANFNAWNRSWQEMSGATPRKASKRARGVWIVVGFVTWLALLAWLVPHAGEKTNAAGLLATLWLLLTLCGVVMAASRVLRWAFAPPTRTAAVPRAARQREYVVSICLPVPWGSPSLARITAGLPDYCQKLLARNSSAAAVSGNAPADSVQCN